MELPGIRRPVIDGLGVDDLEFVVGFDVTEPKVGTDISDDIFAEPDNDLRLDVDVPVSRVTVDLGIMEDKALLHLLAERGLAFVSSYQFNLGGNQYFKNLRDNATAKLQSKLNALAADEPALDKVHMMLFGYPPQLNDQKVAHVNIEGLGWAGAPISLGIEFKVQDSSGAADVTIDLIRFAAGAHRASLGGVVEGVLGLLKSPPGTMG